MIQTNQLIFFFLSTFVRIQGWMQTDRHDTMGWWTESTGTGTESHHPTENPCLLTNMDARYPLMPFSVFIMLHM